MPVLPASGYNTPAAPSIEALPTAPGGGQDIRASADMFGGATAEAMSRFGQSLGQAAGSFENIHKFYQETAAADQSLKTQIEVNKLMYGDPDKPGDRGFIGLEGEHAMREMPERRKQIESIISAARGNLGTQYAVGHFDNEIQRFRNYILTDMGRKYDQEMTKWRDETNKGLKTLSAAESSRAANSGDMARFKESLVNDEMIVRKAGEAEGRPKEAIDAEVGTRRTALALQKAEALLAADPLQGRAFVQANGDILATHQPDLLARANAAVTKQLQDDIIAGKDVSRYSETLPGPMVRGGAVGDAVDKFLNMAEQEESGGRNIPQGIVPPGGGYNPSVGRVTGPSTAQGFFQITNTTWKDFAPGAGVDLAKYPNAMSAPYEIQRQVARQIVTTSGVQHWTDYNKTLRSKAQDAGMPVSGPISGSSTTPAEPPAIAGTDTPAIATTSTLTPPTATRPVTAIGDSLSSHLVRSGGAQGKEDRARVGNYRPGDTAVAGWNSQKILDELIPKLPPELVKDKDVTLSSGVSNAKDAAEAKRFLDETVPAQLAALHEQGAKNIVLMGVGPAEKLKGVNDRLAQIAEQHKDWGVSFAGPQRAPNPSDPDKLHSRDQKAEMGAVQEALSKAPQAAPGTTSGGPTTTPGVNVGSPMLQDLMRGAPERDPGQPADQEVPGLVQALERDAQRLKKANLPPFKESEAWQGIVQKERRIFNAAHVDQQHALQARKREDEENDHQLMQEYRLRLGSDKPPTVAEVTADKRWRSEKNAQEMIGFIGRALKPDPESHVTKANTADLYRRMTDENAADKLSNMDPVNQAYIGGQIGKEDLNFLEKKWTEKTDSKAAEVNSRTERVWKSMVVRQLRPHAAMGPTFEQFQDIQAQDQGQMTSGEREMGWRNKVAEAVAERKAEGKSTKDLFDPKPGNSEYIGSPEFMAEFMPEKAVLGTTKSGPDVSSLDAVKRTYKLENPVEVERAKAAVVKAFQDGKYGDRLSPEAKAKAAAILQGLGVRAPTPQQPPVPMAR